MSAVTAAADVTDPSDEDEFLARLKAFEGRSVGVPTDGPDAVNQAMIRHWVEAMGDENPVYTDEEAARAHGFSGVIAPPTMLQAWIMRGYKATAELAEARAAGRPLQGSSPADDLMHLLDEGGFTSVVATDCEQEYLRPRRPRRPAERLLVDRVGLRREAHRPRCRSLRHHPPALHRHRR